MNGKDAIERITVEYQQLPAVTDTASAAGPAAPRLWEHSSSNVCLDAELGDKAAMPRADAAELYHRAERGLSLTASEAS